MFNENEVNITLRQLVSHMGGIRNYKDDSLIAEPGAEYHITAVLGMWQLERFYNRFWIQTKPFIWIGNARYSEKWAGYARNIFWRGEWDFIEPCQFYKVSENNQLKIAPFVDESCRWPGGDNSPMSMTFFDSGMRWFKAARRMEDIWKTLQSTGFGRE